MPKSGARTNQDKRKAKAKGIRTSEPKGLYPPGTARPIRGNPDKMSATDVPIEVPVYVYYERHIGPPETGRNRGTGRKLTDMDKAPQLLGWTVTVDAFTFGPQVKVKIGHKTHIMEVWVGDEQVFKTNEHRPPGSQSPPRTAPRFDQPVGFGGTTYPDGGTHYPPKDESYDSDMIIDDDDFVEET